MTYEEATPYVLPLNKTVLVFIPNIESSFAPMSSYSGDIQPQQEEDHSYDVSLSVQQQFFTLGEPVGGYVAQVIVRTAFARATPPDVHTLAAYFIAQKEITRVIESLLIANLSVPMPDEVVLVGENNGYVLTGRKKRWAYGETLDFSWGDMRAASCEDKWTFVFEPRSI